MVSDKYTVDRANIAGFLEQMEILECLTDIV